MSQERTDAIKAAGLKSRVAMAWLRDHQLPAEPLCYAIAYEYLHTNDDALKQKIDHLDLTQSDYREQLDDIYRNHILAKRYQQLAMQTGHVSEYVNEMLKMLVTDYDVDKDIDGHMQKVKQLLRDENGEEQIAISENEESYLSVMENTTKDNLTDLLDKNGLFTTLQEAVKHKDNHPMSLILMDIDKFAIFNDSNGTIMGDAVLKQIGKLSNSFFKGTDIVSRLESDKFIIVLPKTGCEQGVKIADELRKKIAAVSLKKKASMTAVKFTVSMGVSELTPTKSIADVLENAKKALNRSIDLGRNCVNIEK